MPEADASDRFPFSTNGLVEGRTLVLVVPLPRQLQTGAKAHP